MREHTADCTVLSVAEKLRGHLLSVLQRPWCAQPQ